MAPLPAVTADQSLVGSGRCATCSSPLAADQLFCLSCGARRRDARIAFRDVLATEAAPVVAQPPGGGWPPNGNGVMTVGGQGPIGPGRITYVPFIATLALLLFALGIGVWIGRKPVQAVAAPTASVPTQIVAPTTPVSTTPDDSASSANDSSSKDSSSTKDSAEADTSSAPVKDDTSTLSNLDKLSPEDYAKQSQKLPDQVGTGGTPPPKDNKPAGGGSDTETFQ